jgi:gliding motility-associated-like protein
LLAINANGCTDAAAVSLQIAPSDPLGPDLWVELCPDGTADLHALLSFDGMNASVTFNGGPVDDAAHVPAPGIYTISASDGNGCMDEVAIHVAQIECPCEADFRHDAICLQEPVRFEVLADSAIISARWKMNGAADDSHEIDPLVWFRASGELRISLELTLSCGMVDLDRLIHLPDCADSCNVWIPSAFSPNNDELNDAWTWRGECDPEEFSVEIFDRLGSLIFASNDPAMAWDGTVRGQWSPAGVYAYRMGYRLPYQERKEVTGSVVLVR